MKFKKILATVLALALMFTMSSTFSVLAVTSADIEIRGTIIKTFDNADFPSKPNLSENEIKQEADNIIKNASNLGLNAIFIDVKPLSEVFYRSEIYPSSYFLTGGQYRNLTFDLLEYIISKGKENGITIYAYISSGKATKIVPETQINQIMLAPFRDPLIDYSSAEIKALSGSYDWQNVLNVTNPAFLHPDWLVQNGSYSYFDIGIPEVRSLIANTAKELSKYDISGILLGSDFYPAENFDDSKSLKQYGKGKDIDTFRKDNIISLVQEVSKALPDNIMLGISPADVFDDKTTSKYFDTSLVINLIDFIMPKIEFNANNEDLTAQYEHWNDITKDTNVKLIHATTLDAVYYEGEDSDKFAVNYQIAMARNNNSSGHIFTDYSGLLSNPANMQSALATIYGDRYVIRDNLNLPISKTLDITRPAENVYLSDSKYFIMGTSDPTLPLYINGVEITNRSENGTFGYMLTLSGNKTTVTAKQGGKSVTRTITKPSGTSTISAITQSSMFPSVDDYYLTGETIKLKCVAPSGGSVSANINGQTIYLKQAAATSKNGVAATYTANYTVPSLANELKNYGKITYTLTYGGKTTTYQSTGKLYMGGASSKPVLKVITDIGNIFSEPDSNSDVEALRLNATVYSAGKSGSFFKLKMGGY
ncbi:MAG: family 10 glycosylhydrolase, partial [Oscillospiraceae bacterium]|nr:family 10 glycosylhydrolase [Oscillospiraceae bacterium]